MYEFYTAPITKFWADSVSISVRMRRIHVLFMPNHTVFDCRPPPPEQIAYMIFLVINTYMVLVKLPPTPSWQEMYCIAYITTLGCEKVREIISSEPVAIT